MTSSLNIPYPELLRHRVGDLVRPTHDAMGTGWFDLNAARNRKHWGDIGVIVEVDQEYLVYDVDFGGDIESYEHEEVEKVHD